jgi:hypothetical protein
MIQLEPLVITIATPEGVVLTTLDAEVENVFADGTYDAVGQVNGDWFALRKMVAVQPEAPAEPPAEPEAPEPEAPVEPPADPE